MEALLAVLPLSLSSGVNLYLTLLALGTAERTGWLDLPGGLDVIGSIPVMVVAGVLFIVEFFADKIPYVDSVWDFLHTFVRPAGALLLTFNLVPADEPELRTAMVLVAGTAALTAHSGKAGFRALVNTSPEPVSNTVVSLAEDVGVVGLIALAVAFPLVALGVSIVLLVFIIVGLYFLVKWARRAYGTVRRFFTAGRGDSTTCSHPSV